ncbi:hypothetical protein [Salinifilum aidingensis]
MSPRTRLARERGRIRRRWPARRLDAAQARRAQRTRRTLLPPVLGTLATLVLLLFGLPVLLWSLPVLTELRVAGVPVSWLLVGAAPFPAMLALTWYHLRRAEEIEENV